MSEHILELHMRKAPPEEPPIASDMLRKYIAYAKGVTPVISQAAFNRLREFYLEMRSASEVEGSPIAITARQLESLVRISEAHARAALREEVNIDDADRAIAIMKLSLEEAGIDVASHKIDIDIIMTGKPKSLQDKLGVILRVLIEMERETGTVRRSDLVDRLATEFNIDRIEAERLLGLMRREGTIYEPREGHLKKT